MKIVMPLMPTDGGRSGIFRYLQRVAPALLRAEAPGDEVRFLCARGDRARFPELPDSRLDFVSDRFANAVPSILWHSALLPARLLAARDTVLLLPAGNRRLCPLSPARQVVVVHDLNQFDVTEKYDPLRMFYVQQLLRRGLLRADKLVAVSGHTANQLRRAGLPADRIAVVENGVDAERFMHVPTAARKAALEHVGLKPGYLLYVSRIEHPGKNHLRLLEAVAQLRRDGVDVPPLLFAGSDWKDAEAVHARAAQPDLQGAVVFGGFVPDEHLPSLYAEAGALVFPSLAEGFGLPLLEAMAADCPVLCSDRSPMSDIAAEAALTFDPEDVDSIRSTLATFLHHPNLHLKLVRRGRERVARYNWRSNADRLWTLAREALQAPARAPRPTLSPVDQGASHGR